MACRSTRSTITPAISRVPGSFSDPRQPRY
nr:MAG TPA: hypothetical protein [Caudoviricetes sp.]